MECLKVNAGDVKFVSKQSKVAGKFTKTLDINICDIVFIWDTGAGVSIFTETNCDMLDFELRKPDCQQALMI